MQGSRFFPGFGVFTLAFFFRGEILGTFFPEEHVGIEDSSFFRIFPRFPPRFFLETPREKLKISLIFMRGIEGTALYIVISTRPSKLVTGYFHCIYDKPWLENVVCLKPPYT